MIVPRYYENLSVLHEGTMPSRAYYIPASRRMECLVERREASGRMQLLNGDWKFRYFDSIYDLEEKFYEPSFDASNFNVMRVPGVWQMAGYDGHQYTNIRYPFPFDPPYVPQDIPCGAYVHTFHYQKRKRTPKAYLNFEGVDSCFYVWLNGIYVGYSQVSHATSEFDVTPYIREGKNKIAVLVLKWCDGSYLEDQDKFRMSGIFRDVYLLKRPERTVFDYRVNTKISKKSAQVKIDLSYTDGPMDTDITIYDMQDQVVASANVQTGNALFEIDQPRLWSAEEPNLYMLVMETKDEVITDYIGFRSIEIRDRVLYLNGQKVKLHGVNRHDSDPQTGCCIGVKQLMRDLTMMKQYNFNAIRSSHYPNSPWFYQLCDRYGFMVMDEADLEAHGPFMLYYRNDSDYNRFKGWNERIADNPLWEKAILDRVQLMVKRDKNRPCILMWSMGNESAYGCNFEKALAWTKSYDPGRITHYESARYRNYDLTYNYSNIDLYSRMYPAMGEIQTYLEKDGSKPFLLVEYCHAMGNGPGDLEDYFKLIHSDDRMCGGFVWEWCDHAIQAEKTEKGKKKYLYGGDHGERVHDGNFCVDGLVYPDRSPHTGLLEYKNIHRPARVVSCDVEAKELRLYNYLDFTDLKDYASVSYEVSCDGVCTDRGTLPVCSVPPHGEASIPLDVAVPKVGSAYLKIIYQTLHASSLIPEGHVLGFDEIRLTNEDGRNQTAVKWLSAKNNAAGIDVAETAAQVVVKGRGFAYTYSKKTGMFERVNYAGREYLDRPMEINLWRAPTDNDRMIRVEWEKAGYPYAFCRAYETVVRQSKDAVCIMCTMSVSAVSVQRILDIEAVWTIGAGGEINASFDVKKNEELPVLPRFGVRLFLDKRLADVSYYGMGPTESYRDKCRAASHGLYRAKVRQMHEDYLRPQENGSHFDCDYVELCNGHFGLAAASTNPFSFNASIFTQEELQEKAHNFELEESGHTILCLDYAQHGIGSNSCGPQVMEPYRFDEVSFTFQFQLVPFVRGAAAITGKE